MGTQPRYTVLAAMRNEGPFIVEWVCWYRMLGFEIVVLTNDCTDNSTELLDRFADAGWLRHLRHQPAPGTPAKASAYRRAMQDQALMSTDWLFICDVDEFLVPSTANSIHELMAPLGDHIAGMVIPWRVFGNGGWLRYKDVLVHQGFRRAGAVDCPPNRWFKSIFRAPARYGTLSDHAPGKPHSGWQSANMQWVDASGRILPEFAKPRNHPMRSLAQVPATPAVHLNHYIIRSMESFELKRGTPCASAKADRYGDDFLRYYNRNGFLDLSAYRFEDRFAPVHAAAMALPQVHHIHHICCAQYVQTLLRHQKRSPDKDPRFAHHVEQAEMALPPQPEAAGGA